MAKRTTGTRQAMLDAALTVRRNKLEQITKFQSKGKEKAAQQAYYGAVIVEQVIEEMLNVGGKGLKSYLPAKAVSPRLPKGKNVNVASCI